MATKGTIAKENVEKKIREVFGQDFTTVLDKKLYVYADDGGDKIQIAISLTCPKIPIGVADSDELDFSADAPVSAVSKPATAITPEETANLEDLLKKFNL